MQTDTMSLTAKGPLVRVPVLPVPLQRVSEAIQAWPGTVAATHWDLYDRTRVDGADFYVGDQELGHVHLNGDMHLATSKPLRDKLLEHRLAQPFPWYDCWIQFSIKTEVQAQHAIWLFRLNYDRINGVNFTALVAEIDKNFAH